MSNQPKLELRVRYYQDSTPPGVPCIETNFTRREIVMPLSVQATALILVDVWNVLYIKNWIERAKKITVNAIVPVIEKARVAGLTIVHAPSPEVAEKYPLSTKYALDTELFCTPKMHDWPPKDFVKRQGDYRIFAGPRDQAPGVKNKQKELQLPPLNLSPAIKVHPNDYMVSTGSQLQRVLKHKRILHLIYVGFATNICIVDRDYGMRSMSKLGYNTILLRDSTTGVEWPDTVGNLFATELAIRRIENKIGFSASNEDFFKACEQVIGVNL